MPSRVLSGARGASRRRLLLLPLCLLWLTAPPLAAATGPSDGQVDLEGMTYVSSRAGKAEVVLSAARADYRPSEDVVHLRDVRLRVSEHEGVVGFRLTCDRGVLDLEAGDFEALGDVQAHTRDGRELRTERLRYRHESSLVATDAPVEIRDSGGRYRGGGFEYHVREARFRLLGGAALVQEP